MQYKRVEPSQDQPKAKEFKTEEDLTILKDALKLFSNSEYRQDIEEGFHVISQSMKHLKDVSEEAKKRAREALKKELTPFSKRIGIRNCWNCNREIGDFWYEVLFRKRVLNENASRYEPKKNIKSLTLLKFCDKCGEGFKE